MSMRLIRRAANGLSPGSPAARNFIGILESGHPFSIPDPTRRQIYFRGLNTVYGGLNDEARFRQFLRRFVGRRGDRVVLEYFGDPDVMWSVPAGVWEEALLPGADIEESIAKILARYIVIEADFDRLARSTNRTLSSRMRAIRGERDFLANRHQLYADALADGVNPRRPDLSNIDFDALGFDPDFPDAPAWLGFQRYGLLGWGDFGTNINRHIELPHPDFPFTNPAYADVAGSLEGLAVWTGRRGPDEFSVQADFIANLRERIEDALGSGASGPVDLLSIPYNASHLGAHRHGFLTRFRGMVALHQRLNTSFMGRWERYVDFFKRRHGIAYVRSRVLDYHTYEFLPDILFPSRLEYQIFVPDPDFPQRPLLVFNDTQATLIAPDYTRSALDREWFMHRMLMREEGLSSPVAIP